MFLMGVYSACPGCHGGDSTLNGTITLSDGKAIALVQCRNCKTAVFKLVNEHGSLSDLPSEDAK